MNDAVELFLETFYNTKQTIPFKDDWVLENGDLAHPKELYLPEGWVCRSTNILTGMKVLIVGTESGTFAVYLDRDKVVLASSPVTFLNHLDLEVLLDNEVQLAA